MRLPRLRDVFEPVDAGGQAHLSGGGEMHQTRERIFKGNTHVPGKLVSLFEPHTEVIRKGKAAKPTEFGKMVKIQEAEAQIVTHYEVYGERPSDCDLLLPAIALHEQLLGRKPYLVTADAGFFSQRNENAALARGIKRVAIPNRSTKSVQRKKLEKKRWFRNAQRWRTGCEGRISLLKRRHGLNRCRYKGMPGIQRWVGESPRLSRRLHHLREWSHGKYVKEIFS